MHLHAKTVVLQVQHECGGEADRPLERLALGFFSGSQKLEVTISGAPRVEQYARLGMASLLLLPHHEIAVVC